MTLEQLDDDRPMRPTGKGRPRSAAASRAILDATLDLIAEEGKIDAVTVEAVAERSGVSKATIYRRWSTKEELIATAVETIKSPVHMELPHTSVRDDLSTIARNIRKDFSEREQTVLACVALELRTNPEYRRIHEELHERRRELVRGVLRAGIERGELREDIDVDLAVVMLVSPILSIQAYDNHPELKTPDLADRVIDHLLRGLQRHEAE